jgi:hypothetical protein
MTSHAGGPGEYDEPDYDGQEYDESEFDALHDTGSPDEIEPEFDDETKSDDGARLKSVYEPVFGSVEAFVTGYLLPLYRRAVSGNSTTWCAEWWKHPEAIVRLDAVWRAWEHLRLDPSTGMSVWLRDHCDYHMRVLLSADGAFKGCTREAHATRPVGPLPSSEMPVELAQRLQAASAGELGGV